MIGPQEGIRRYLYYGFLWLVCLAFFSPVAWIMLGALKTRDALLSMPPAWLFSPTLENIIDAASRPNFLLFFRNSVILSLTSVGIAIVVAFLAAYSFSRYRPPGTDFLMFLLLSIRMVPAAAVVLPVFLMYAAIGWGGSFSGMVLFYAMFSIPFSVWILKGFIDGVSPRFDETARINGGSRLHILFRIILPQVKPGLVAAFIFNLIFVWNEFLFNFVLGGRSSTMIPVQLATGLTQGGGVDWTYTASLTTIYVLPIIIAVYFFQRYLLIGMTFGTVRGEV